MSLTITNINTGAVGIGDNFYEDGVLTFGAAGTAPQGLIVARVSSKFVVYNPAGEDGSQIPVAVLDAPVVAGASGDVPCRPLISGPVRLDLLVVGLAGTPGTVTAAQRDLLRQTAIIPLAVNQLSQLDNQ